ncbi:hypothetical protein [Microbacterium sp.]|uniref:hypothetical protein n=1 Tax=Microbacterium sp. TaxID=51671 RepID=UPI0039E27E26
MAAASPGDYLEGVTGGQPVATNTGREVVVQATVPGSESGGPRRTTDTDSTGPAPLASAAPCDRAISLCRDGYTVGIIRQPTLTDLASFAPAPPALTSEPTGIGIAGLPTNFVATGSEHTATGELFSLPVTVRFTPTSFTFDHGDSTTTTTPTGGNSWTDTGQAQFTPTPTSHAYPRRGTYTATTTVTYTAAVNFGNGWIDVPGTLPLTSTGNTIQVYEARTALVAHTCIEDPTGPGC